MKNLLRPLLLIAVSVSLFTSCIPSKLIPMYTSVEKLANLNPGMSKDEALSTLDNLYPFDILNGESNLCEIHHYKYKHLYQNVSGDVTAEKSLRGGAARYMQEKDAYLVYKDGKLYSITSSIGNSDFGKLMADIQNLKNACDGQAIVKGCTDPESLNYNPDAVTDDGSCQYCECGKVKNPKFNPKAPKSDCNAPCISVETAEKEEESDCTSCDVIKNLKGSNVTLNLSLDGSSKKSSAKKEGTKLNIKNPFGK